MNLGKTIRLNRIFSHSSGRLCSAAIDHFIGYQQGLPPGLTNLPDVLKKMAAGRPDAVTMMKGVAKNAWAPYAGRIPLIVSSVCFTADDLVIQSVARPEEALRLGADAIAVAIGVRGRNEGQYLKMLATAVEEADRLNFPVIAHIYPRDFAGAPRIVHDPENVLWAVRCGIECGADVIKAPFTGDAASFAEIVATSPVPVVAAGGPKADSLAAALDMMSEVVRSGARGATIGRNIWGDRDPLRALLAFKSVLHEGLGSEEALRHAGSPATAETIGGMT